MFVVVRLNHRITQSKRTSVRCPQSNISTSRWKIFTLSIFSHSTGKQSKTCQLQKPLFDVFFQAHLLSGISITFLPRSREKHPYSFEHFSAHRKAIKKLPFAKPAPSRILPDATPPGNIHDLIATNTKSSRSIKRSFFSLKKIFFSTNLGSQECEQ